MHIHVVPNRGSTPTVLLRESFREGTKVRKRTLANLSSLSPAQVEAIRAVLKGERMAPIENVFEVVGSLHHGHVQAVFTAMQRLGFESLIASRPSRERSLAIAMVAARILEPNSKLATTRWWHDTTLPEILGVADATEKDLYEAMDWLLERQSPIEKKLAARHLAEGGLVLYDLSSSYFEGTKCPLAALGHNRDGKRGKLQVNYGLLTDRRGCPVAISVFKGNTNDPKTLIPQVQKVRDEFGIAEMVLVGDRGMISQKQIDGLKGREGVEWITALRSQAIRGLVESKSIQMGLFDERGLFELTHSDFPGERLVACRNPELAKARSHKRQSLLKATIEELDRVKGMVARGTLRGKADIGVRVGKVVNKYKVAKHIQLEIRDDVFGASINEESVSAEAALDGIYVLRTRLTADRLSADDTVRSYKLLANVERDFRSLKTVDLDVRPIHHRLEDRVRAHIFLCMLAQYVRWHMQEAWRPLLFCDEDQRAKETRHPVALAQRSEGAARKAATKTLEDGTPVHSFRTLLDHLRTVVRNRCRRPGSATATINVDTTLGPDHLRAFELLETIRL
jgi:transposase